MWPTCRLRSKYIYIYITLSKDAKNNFEPKPKSLKRILIQGQIWSTY